MRFSIVVACSTNGVIGRDGELPWRLSNDLRYFKRLTMGHPILMGRKTLQSIGRLLPGRATIVLTRDRQFRFPGALVAHDWEHAVRRVAELTRANSAWKTEELFVVGGAEIYQLALAWIDRIYLTQVNAFIVGDTYFPRIDRLAWRETHREDFDADAQNDFPHSLVTLDRVDPA